jgi:hypothetical protein
VKSYALGLAAFVVLLLMLELPRNLRGPTWAVALAELCIYVVGAAAIFGIAGVYDSMKRQQRRERDAQE